MIAVVRSIGSMKVVFVDGFGARATACGTPRIFDPLNKVLYAANPYANRMNAAFNQTTQAKMRGLSR
jgi:hypothetical protein